LQDRDHFLFRIPEACRQDYRPWLTPHYNGWADSALLDAMTPRQQRDPEALFQQDGGERVRSKRNLTVRIRINGEAVWLKRFRPANPVDRFVYAVRPGKAVYAWNAAMALLENGFHAPRPVVGLRSAGRLGGAAGIVAFEDVAGATPLRQVLDAALARETGSELASVMGALGPCLRRFHDLGFRHRDLRSGNILAAPEGDGWSFCFIDLNRLRIQPPLTTMQRLREVEKLGLPERGLIAFFEAYMPDRDAHDMTALYTARVRHAGRLQRLPAGKLVYKAWYYWWEARAFSRARRP